VVILLLAASLAGIVGVTPAQAIVTVDCDAPGYLPGDLQSAILAEQGGGIVNVTGSCTETGIDITGDLTLLGSGSATTVIDGGGFNSVIDIGSGANVDISGVTLTNGTGRGAGLDNFGGGVVNVFDSVVTGNVGNAGGGIWTNRSVTLTDSTVGNNSATGAGGGIHNSNGTIAITDSTVGPNTAGGLGGGIYNTGASASVTVANSTISGNHALQAAGAYSTAASSLVLTSSTVSGNVAGSDVGGVWNAGASTSFTNTTVSGNTAPRIAGGVANTGGSVTFTNATVTANSARVTGGVHNETGGAITSFHGTIVAGNTAPLGPDCRSISAAVPTSLGYNLIGDDTGCSFPAGGTGDQVGTGVAPIDPKLGPLQDNGSPHTHALLQASPAINAIPPASCIPGTDERGVIRPQGTDCDIGAYEATPATTINATYSVPQLGTLTAAPPGVLGNDTDVEGDTLTATKVTDPANGALALNADGSFTYKPIGGFVGSDTFTYEANDATGTSNPATVTINVTPRGHDVGLVDVTSGKWYLRDATSGAVTSFFYGNPVDLPISGDWNGDGVSTPGLYRQSDGFFYARDTNTQGPADNGCFAGDPSDTPVVGDWDGDGDDNLGIYRPSEQKFYLFTTTCTGTPMGAAPIVLGFGNPGDKPVAGDWDGDGMDEIGLHRESTGLFYWRNTLDTGVASGQILFGDPSDLFVAGDWGIVDGVDSPAIFRPSDLKFFFRHTVTQGVADSEFAFPGAASGWLPVSGIMGLS
jgi:hypothetical protein